VPVAAGEAAAAAVDAAAVADVATVADATVVDAAVVDAVVVTVADAAATALDSSLEKSKMQSRVCVKHTGIPLKENSKGNLFYKCCGSLYGTGT
jgi:hypothetical protein